MKKNQNTKQAPQVFNISLAEVKLPSINVTQLQRSADDWVKYGDNNQFPVYLNETVNKSTAHQSFIEKRQELIKSEGLTYSDDIASFLENINEDFETADDLLELTATDLSILETFALQVRYNKLKNRIVAIDYIDSSSVRPSKTLDERGKITGYWLCADWSNTSMNKPVFYERFNPNNVKETTQVYFYHKRALRQPYLPEVSYASALNYIELAYQLSKFGLNTTMNGFLGSVIVSVKGSMTEEQKVEFTTKLKNSFAGSENAGKMLVNISEDTDTITITPVNTGDFTPMMKALKDWSVAEVCSAHKGQGIIAGIQSEGSTLGSDGKLYRDSLEIYYNTVIRRLQRPFITFLEKVLRFNGYSDFELDVTSSALLVNSLDVNYKADYLKPEVWLAEYGYNRDDIKPEMLEEEEVLPDVEISENVQQDSEGADTL